MTVSDRKDRIPWDIQKIWERVSAVENYPTWRSDVSHTETVDENRFLIVADDGYSTTVTITAAKPCSRFEFDVENSHIREHWTIGLVSEDGETEISITAWVEAKKLVMRPTGKSVFEKTYLNRELSMFVKDLKNGDGCL